MDRTIGKNRLNGRRNSGAAAKGPPGCSRRSVIPDQLQFDFEGRNRNQDRDDGTGPKLPRDPFVNGYDDFRTEQAAAVRAMDERFGVILNKHVRLKLIGWDEVFEGRLMLNQLLYPIIRNEGLRLRIGKVDFDYTDIEYCHCMET